MENLLAWLQKTSPEGSNPLPAVTRAGIAHIWFESIHPFEDGNGRIGRAIIEKCLGQGIQPSCFVGISHMMLKHRKTYYQKLEDVSRTLDITDWLLWFGAIVLQAQERVLNLVKFIVFKARLFQTVAGKLNERQEKALLRVFEEGPEGFIGGLSAANYMRITGATSATTTRDLSEMLELGIFHKTGERKSTRYHLIF